MNNLNALWTFLLEAVKVSQLMDGSDQVITTPSPWFFTSGPCGPDAQSSTAGSPKTGFCAGTSQLETKCAKYDIGRSSDCAPFEGHWCCYVTSVATVKPFVAPMESSRFLLDLLQRLPVADTTVVTTPTVPSTTTSTTTTTTTTPSTTPSTTSTTPTTSTSTTVTSTTSTTASTTPSTTPTSPATTPPTSVSTTTPSSNSSGNSSTNRVADSTGNLTEVWNNDGETRWKWSTGQATLVVATNKLKDNVVTDVGAVQTQSVGILPTGINGGFRRGRQWISPSSNPCLMWMSGQWVDCWSDPRIF